MAVVFFLLWGCDEVVDPCAGGHICTVIGTGDAGLNGQGLPAEETWLYLPTTVELAPSGAPLVVDYNNMLVRELRDGKMETIAGNGLHEFATPGAKATESALENPFDAKYGPDGLLYILPSHESRLLRVNAGGVIEVVAGTGEEGYAGDGLAPVEATFYQPNSFDIDSEGVIWIADTLNGALRRAGTEVSTVLSGLGNPQRVRVYDGGVYITDTYGGTVLRYDEKQGTTETVVDGLTYPWGVEIAENGVLYVADSGTSRILRVEGEQSTVVAGTGESGFSGDEGPADQAQLNWPTDVAIGAEGEIYIADMQNARIRLISPR